MSILNVNAIQPVGSGQTITVNATDFKIGTTTLSSSGLVNPSAGSTSAPSISPVGDSNTGIFFPASDTVAIAEGGTEVIRVDSSGRVGVGTNRMTRPFEVWSGTAGTSFSIDSSGRVFMPFQPSFHIKGTATETSFTTNTKLPFNTKYFDVGSNFDTTNNRFTAPVAGKYFFYASYLTFNAADPAYVTLVLAVNGTRNYDYGFSRRINASQEDRNLSSLLNLNVNDYVEAWVEPSSGTNYYYVAAGHAHFFGYLVG